ncbi:MAG: ABC transporter permease [Chloroflexi bacterium]|nr:ABC transporter permease [Chloroflexota bacterium]
MTVLVFIMARVSGDPVGLLAGERATREEREMIRKDLGLDKPLVTQYVIFFRHMVRGDFGRSLLTQQSAAKMVGERISATVQLAGVAFLFSVLIAVPLGVITAVKRDSWIDYVGKVFAFLGMATPGFWLGIMLIFAFAVTFELLPAGGRGGPQYLILPAVSLGWHSCAGVLRLTRSATLDALDSEYIKMARIKGLPEWKVVWKHAFRNALIPPLTLATVLLSTLLTGSVITEQVFAYPGLGALAIQSVNWRDYSVLQTVILLYTVIFVAMNLFVDLMYAYIDPRIRYG